MIYYVVPIDSSQERVVETLNMYAELSNEGAVEISTEEGFKRIRITSSDMRDMAVQYPVVHISVKGNLGSRYRIYQNLEDPMMKGSAGERFDLSRVTYKITDSTSGAVTKEGDMTDLRTKSLVYASDDLGSSSEIAIKFEPAEDFSEQQTGIYTGVINYTLEMENVRTLVEPGNLDSIDVEFEVEPIFRIVATSLAPDGSESTQEGSVVLSFGEVSYKAGPKESKVRMKIESNLNKPYLITQKIMGLLQNDRGNRIPSELFTFQLSATENTKGTLKFDRDMAVDPENDVTIFVSNSTGESDEFEITYRLRVTVDTPGGDYNTGVSYSLSEL
jgi:hypothetical protein